MGGVIVIYFVDLTTVAHCAQCAVAVSPIPSQHHDLGSRPGVSSLLCRTALAAWPFQNRTEPRSVLPNLQSKPKPNFVRNLSVLTLLGTTSVTHIVLSNAVMTI